MNVRPRLLTVLLCAGAAATLLVAVAASFDAVVVANVVAAALAPSAASAANVQTSTRQSLGTTGEPVSLRLGDGRDPALAERIGDITVHGTLEIGTFRLSKWTFVNGISGLGWSEDTQTLFAVSDGGLLWQWRPVFDKGQLVRVEVLRVTRLRNLSGKVLRGNYLTDAEGLTVVEGNNGFAGDEHLIISFELKPRVGIFNAGGEAVQVLPLPGRFRKVHNYATDNKSIEAITAFPDSTSGQYHLLAGSERPMRGSPANIATVFSSAGREWQYQLGDGPNVGLVAMEYLADGAVVFLERGYSAFPPRLMSRISYLPSLPAPNTRLQPRALAEMDTLRGHRIDNFEGLAHHRGNHFFVVSDDNDSFLQRTLLMYVELRL